MTPHLVLGVVARLSTAAVGAIAIVELAVAILAPEGGPLGVLQIVAPHLAIVGLVLIPFALLVRRPPAGWVAVALLVITVARFGGDWLSLPASAPADSIRLDVATWNVEVDSRSGVTTAEFLRGTAADVIGLQELQPDTAAAIDADLALRARFPYRVLVPRRDVIGLGLLSRYPIVASAFSLDPAIQQATLDLGSGRRLAVLNAHPLHADIASLGGTRLPLGLDVDQRNADLVTIRARLDASASGGLPAILLGDLNTAASEPAFDRLVRGLRDVHAEVGLGTGWTWRPIRLEFLGVGILRIDHVIVSPDIAPLGIDETCPAVGDHCLVHATIAVPATAG